MSKYDFVEAFPADPAVTGDDTSWWATVEGKPGEPDELIDDAFESKAEAEKAGKAYKALMNDYNQEWWHEQAMEEGMLHGIDAYNEFLGY